MSINSFVITSPLDQFEIRNFISLDAPLFGNIHLSLTNIGLYLTISAFLVLIVNLLAQNYNKVISNNWSISQETLYATIHSIVINQINSLNGQIYFPFVYTLFIFILVNNLIGMVRALFPYDNNNFKLIGDIRAINTAGPIIGALIMSKRKVQSKYSVNWYSTSNLIIGSSSILLNPNWVYRWSKGVSLSSS